MTERHSMTRRGTIGSAGRAARTDAGRAAPGWPAVVLRVAGSGLLIATAAIHLDLYLTGYRTIPTIGWLFLLQVIAAFGLGLAVLAIPRRLVTSSRLAAAASPRVPGRSARSGEPTALSSSPTTGIRSTPTSATRLPARPGATTSTSTAGSGTTCLSPGNGTATEVTSPGISRARPGPAKENPQWPHRTLCSLPAGPTGR
jgi:hypothetical protein